MPPSHLIKYYNELDHGTTKNILLTKIFIQSTPLLHEAASDAVCALLQVVADQENDEASHDGQMGSSNSSSLAELRNLEDSLVLSIKSLEPSYHLAVAEEDTER